MPSLAGWIRLKTPVEVRIPGLLPGRTSPRLETEPTVPVPISVPLLTTTRLLAMEPLTTSLPSLTTVLPV